MRLLAIIYLLSLGLIFAKAQDSCLIALELSSDRIESSTIDVDGYSLHYYLAKPQASINANTLIMLPDSIGITDWHKWFANQLADQGYYTLVLDGNSCLSSSSDSSMMMHCMQESINSVCMMIDSLPGTSGKIALAGFSNGGVWAFKLAMNSIELDALLIFDAIVEAKPPFSPVFKPPTYGFYGSNDHLAKESLIATKKAIAEAKCLFLPMVYSQADQGFLQKGTMESASSANRKAFNSAWNRINKILKYLF